MIDLIALLKSRIVSALKPLDTDVFSFDPDKDVANQKKHGLSLAFAARVVADPQSIEWIDDRFDYGEERWNVIGMVAGVVYVATYCDKDDGVRFISVRAATKRETDRYFNVSA